MEEIKRLQGTEYLFIHIGRRTSAGADMLIMPMGLPMLADQLVQAGFRAAVWNYALSSIAGGPSLNRLVREASPRVVCLPLHWYAQAPAVLAAARGLKKSFPGVKILLGGFTASYFAEEIMRSFPCVDLIIKGDAEVPLVRLARALRDGSPLARVPNLCWRDGGRPRDNGLSYVAAPADLGRLSFSSLDLVLNKDEVLKGRWRCAIKKGRPRWPDEGDPGPKVYYNPGRGCPYTCSFCGGSRCGQELMCSRSGAVFKPLTSALKDIEGFLSHGVRTMHVCFDPLPSGDYYSRLFREVVRRGLRFSMVFECWGLPSPSFMADFAAAFPAGSGCSRLILSPESGSEKVRRLNKGLFYTNRELLRALAGARSLGISCEACFASDLPGETEEDFAATVSLGRALRSRLGCEKSMSGIPLEPGSPMSLRPERYGIRVLRRGLADYLGRGAAVSFGYSLKGSGRPAPARKRRVFMTSVRGAAGV